MEVDPVRQTFRVESSELLEEMEKSLLRMESSPDDTDAINALFRAAHTIKGSSGIVGIETVERFTHVVESVLDKVRCEEVRVTGDLIEVLLKCRDHISNLVDLAMEDSPPDQAMQAEGQALHKDLSKYLKNSNSGDTILNSQAIKYGVPRITTGCGKKVESENWHISLRFAPTVLQDGMDPISFINYLSRLGEIVSLITITDSMPPAAEMDPEICYPGFEIEFRSDFDKKTIDDVFEFVREGSTIHILPPKSNIASYIELINNLPEDPLKLGELLVKGGALSPSELEYALEQQNTDDRPIGEILVNDCIVHPEVVDAAVVKQTQAREVKCQEARTIRVDTGKLDQLVTLVGELVIANATIDQQALRLKDGDLIESASAMARLVEEIREKAMQVRMVPINEIFSRFQRVVRDICHNTGKDIELVINGGDTEVDKTVVEKISDPLMHLVRNSADHGIELPDARVSKGKPAKGVITLNAFNDAGSIVIEVSDNGSGLDRDRILKKALERGLVSQNQALSDNELFRLIFEPGFSTAEQVTKLSGRGVGMDVVKRNIEALRGTVDVESPESVGTVVRIRLPLTLAIIDGFMVGIGGSSYIIPLDMVVECIELSEADRLAGEWRNYVDLRGEVLPYIRLRDLFDEKSGLPHYEHIVVVRYAGRQMGMGVDELHGEVQAVIKSLGRFYREIEGLSGATILGDGTVALILDVPRLIQSVEKARSYQ